MRSPDPRSLQRQCWSSWTFARCTPIAGRGLSALAQVQRIEPAHLPAFPQGLWAHQLGGLRIQPDSTTVSIGNRTWGKLTQQKYAKISTKPARLWNQPSEKWNPTKNGDRSNKQMDIYILQITKTEVKLVKRYEKMAPLQD